MVPMSTLLADAAPATRGTSSSPDWLSPLVTGLTLVALVGFSLGFNAPAWTARAIAVLGFAFVGVFVAVGPVRRRHPQVALPALAFLAVATVAALVSGDVAKATFGLYGHGTGLLFAAGMVGAWGLGAAVGDRWQLRLERAVLIGVAINAVVALIQVLWAPPVDGFNLTDGRPTGLFGSAEHFAAAMAAATAMVGWRRMPARWERMVTMAAAGGVALSGTAEGVVLVVVLVSALLLRRTGPDWAAAGAVVAGYLVVVVAAGALGPVEFEDPAGFATDSTQGLVTSGKAFATDPLFGTGPGLYRTGATAQRTRALAESALPEAVWLDGRNIVADAAVTVGAFGALALAAWVVQCLRRGRGSWRAAGAVLVVFHLIAPLDAGMTMVTFVALGAAMRTPGESGSVHPLAALALIPALLLGGVLLVGDLRLESGYTDHNAERADAAANLLPMWTEPLDAAGRALLLERITRRDAEAGELARRRYEQAVALDPTDAASWNRLGEVNLTLGDFAAAEEHYGTALDRYPWSVRARLGLAEIALAQGRIAEARGLAEEAQSIVPTGVGADVLARVEAATGLAG